MTNDNVVEFPRELSDEESYMVSVATIQGVIADLMQEGRLTGLGVIMLTDEGVSSMWVSSDGDPIPFLGGAELFKSRILSDIQVDTDDDDTS